MYLLTQIITSFISSAGFGIIFNAPRRALFQCGLAGMLGWTIYVLLDPYFATVISTVAATFMVGIVSQISAKIYRMPIIIFSVAGIIPLVPGGLAYDSMRKFVENDYNTAVQLAAQASLISGSIAIGLVLSEVLNQLLRLRPKRP